MFNFDPSPLQAVTTTRATSTHMSAQGMCTNSSQNCTMCLVDLHLHKGVASYMTVKLLYGTWLLLPLHATFLPYFSRRLNGFSHMMEYEATAASF